MSLLRTGWEVQGQYNGVTKGYMEEDTVSGWASWYLYLSWGVAERSSSLSKKSGLWGACSYGINWLARTGQTGLTVQRDRNRLEKGVASGTTVVGNRLGSSTLALDVRQASGSGGCHQFHCVAGGAEYCVCCSWIYLTEYLIRSSLFFGFEKESISYFPLLLFEFTRTKFSSLLATLYIWNTSTM